jgi:hypothetical protein
VPIDGRENRRQSLNRAHAVGWYREIANHREFIEIQAIQRFGRQLNEPFGRRLRCRAARLLRDEVQRGHRTIRGDRHASPFERHVERRSCGRGCCSHALQRPGAVEHEGGGGHAGLRIHGVVHDDPAIGRVRLANVERRVSRRRLPDERLTQLARDTDVDRHRL